MSETFEHGEREAFEAWWLSPSQQELRDSCAKGWAERVWNAALASAPQPAEQKPISAYTCTVPDDCETLHWRGQILSMNELVSVAQPVVDEEIHVHIEGLDVLTLPLASSGMSAPRFVVHVPAQQHVEQQPAPDVTALVEALEAALMVMTSQDVRLEKQADAITMVRSQLAALSAHNKQEGSDEREGKNLRKAAELALAAVEGQEPVAWIRKNGFRFKADIEPQDDNEIPLYAHPPATSEVSALVEALEECAASLAWNCFGECRAIHAGPIMPATKALEMARKALAAHKAGGEQ